MCIQFGVTSLLQYDYGSLCGAEQFLTKQSCEFGEETGSNHLLTKSGVKGQVEKQPQCHIGQYLSRGGERRGQQ